jgi:hypothetical protein
METTKKTMAPLKKLRSLRRTRLTNTARMTLMGTTRKTMAPLKKLRGLR